MIIRCPVCRTRTEVPYDAGMDAPAAAEVDLPHEECGGGEPVYYDARGRQVGQGWTPPLEGHGPPQVSSCYFQAGREQRPAIGVPAIGVPAIGHCWGH